MKYYAIGEAARVLEVSTDTLRYYEKIGLIPRVERNRAGVRQYREKDLSRLRFIRRAQAMRFSLGEIGLLLQMRENPTGAHREARSLTLSKLEAVKDQIGQLELLRQELQLLLNLCRGSGETCPIIEHFDSGSP